MVQCALCHLGSLLQWLQPIISPTSLPARSSLARPLLICICSAHMLSLMVLSHSPLFIHLSGPYDPKALFSLFFISVFIVRRLGGWCYLLFHLAFRVVGLAEAARKSVIHSGHHFPSPSIPCRFARSPCFSSEKGTVGGAVCGRNGVLMPVFFCFALLHYATRQSVRGLFAISTLGFVCLHAVSVALLYSTQPCAFLLLSMHLCSACLYSSCFN
ncbi:hypothetical protein BDY21DRAFT_66585 [Lineolata rhizophorae]|uniref:Uncharacterized protein n=1 Tax=Lineolata rhizophorae TaxID=578093 RepID=A0A6A6NUN5_9PEZI|nr:hypothetical protein BDY21DRAFT_66585 [Lineolata rhizophorae]